MRCRALAASTSKMNVESSLFLSELGNVLIEDFKIHDFLQIHILRKILPVIFPYICTIEVRKINF